MTKIHIKSAPWPSAEAFTATVTPAAALGGINLLQDTHTRLCEADELRQQRKFDHAQKICESASILATWRPIIRLALSMPLNEIMIAGSITSLAQ